MSAGRRPSVVGRLLSALCCAGLTVVAWPGDDRGSAGVAPPRFEQGLHLHLENIAPGAALAAGDDRRARGLALHVEAGEPASPFLVPGPFRATWRGVLEVPRRDDFVFSCVARGRFRLELDGAVVLEVPGTAREPVAGAPVRLKKGPHELVAHYTSPLIGVASVRVAWQCRKFGAEPIPKTALSFDADGEAVRRGALRRRGRQLVAERRCVRCHEAPAGAGGEHGMLELDMPAADLRRAGDRLRAGWMAAWIADPRRLRAGARMPAVLAGDPEQVAQDAADLAAWLASLGAGGAGGVGSDDAVTAESAVRGGRLFADLGCIACHTFDPVEASAEADGAPPPISLGHADAKWRPGALAEFLREPRRHDPFTRMPDFGLDAAEAKDLAAFVRAHGRAELPAAARAGDAGRGRELARAHGCGSCHALDLEPGEAASPEASLADVLAGDLDAGCLAGAPDRRGTAPAFALAADDRLALRAFAAQGLASLGRRSAVEFTDRQVVERRCNACHVLDGAADRWTEREHLLDGLAIRARGPGERAEPELAQLRPALTEVGEKLRPAWLRSFLDGSIASPRGWLRARMPTLAAPIAHELARGLGASYGYGGDEPAAAAVDPALVAVGRRLIEQQGGFGCVTCHAVGTRVPVALFEVQGVNFKDVKARLRPEYYRRWLRDPPRIAPASKMPRYKDENGRTAFTDVLGGDAERQFDAIWQFLQAAEELR